MSQDPLSRDRRELGAIVIQGRTQIKPFQNFRPGSTKKLQTRSKRVARCMLPLFTLMKHIIFCHILYSVVMPDVCKLFFFSACLPLSTRTLLVLQCFPHFLFGNCCVISGVNSLWKQRSPASMLLLPPQKTQTQEVFVAKSQGKQKYAHTLICRHLLHAKK